jgi:hypothetical protein
VENAMDENTRGRLAAIYSKDLQLQNAAFLALIAETDHPVAWAYEAWDELVKALTHHDNHVRAIAAQVLCNLAKSDPQKRMAKDFQALLNVTRDERFVTARHTMQSLWKVGAAGADQLTWYLAGLTTRFNECITEKNCTLIRYDIIQSLRNAFDAAKSEIIRQTALDLIETETDVTYRQKYAALWKTKTRQAVT